MEPNHKYALSSTSSITNLFSVQIWDVSSKLNTKNKRHKNKFKWNKLLAKLDIWSKRLSCLVLKWWKLRSAPTSHLPLQLSLATIWLHRRKKLAEAGTVMVLAPQEDCHKDSHLLWSKTSILPHTKTILLWSPTRDTSSRQTKPGVKQRRFAGNKWQQLKVERKKYWVSRNQL